MNPYLIFITSGDETFRWYLFVRSLKNFWKAGKLTELQTLDYEHFPKKEKPLITFDELW